MAQDAGGEFRQSWRIVLCGWIGAIFGQNGFAYASFGLLAEPLAKAFGQSLPAISGWVTFYFLGSTVASPIIGTLSDRIGARKILCWGIPTFALVWVLASLMKPELWLLWVVAFVAGSIAIGASPLVYGRVINTWFLAGRGTALGIMSSGIGLSYFFGPVVVQRMIDAHGWRSGFVLFAVACLVPWPLVLRWCHERREAVDQKAVSIAVEGGYSVREALMLPTFWCMGASLVLYGISTGGVTFNMVPFLTASGLSRANAAYYMGLLGVFSIAGRVITGFSIDRVHAAFVCCVILIIEAAAFCTFGLFGARFAAIAIAATGFAFGGEVSCIGYLVSRYFGLKHYGTILGLLSIVSSLGVAGGPPFFSLLREHANSYTVPFLAAAGVAAGAAVCFGILRMYPFYQEPAPLTPAVSSRTQ